MQEVRRRKAIAVGLRARVPFVTRLLALSVLIAGLVYVGISYYRSRNNEPFRLRGEAPELSKTITSIVEGYERRVMDGDKLRMLVRAARDITYDDGHHELETVHLEMYPQTGDRPDKIDAQRAVYAPESKDSDTARVTFTGNVVIDTRDSLNVKTESIVYDQKSEVAETAVPITFARENVSGHSTGAVVDTKNKHLVLRRDVEITIAPNANQANTAKPNLRAQPLVIHAGRATFDQALLRLDFMDGATAEQGRDIMSGDKLSGTLNEQKRLQKIEARGNSYLRSMTEGRAAEVHAADIDFNLNENQQLQSAAAIRDVRAQSLDADSEMQLAGASKLDVNFDVQAERSLLKEMRAEGRTVVTLAAPQSRAGDPRAASKRLTADSMKLVWRATGRDLERAEMVGNAELFIDPVQKNAAADRKTLTAPRFDCDFYETGNLAKTFTATGGVVKAVIDPVQPSEQRATRTMTAEKMTTVFVRETQDVERIDAEGDAKFNEQDRNGRAASASYTAGDEMVRLRGNDPTVWDSRARIKAVEIDSDTRNDISYGRGKTTTTYYSQEQTNGAAPFSKVNSPVFIVAERAEFRHLAGVGIYTGNARAWQDDNFVRADRITLNRETKRMDAEGHVQTALYQAKRKNSNGSQEAVPVFATSNSMWYSAADRLLHYEGNVDIKQGTERITSGTADVYLLKESNEVERTIAERDVVLMQPGRRGGGDWAQYTAADETVVLKGNPARVEDADQGTSEGGRLTVYLRDSRVIADGGNSSQSTGRVRSTHRVRKQ